jgi:virulence-associated protein VagC
MITVKIRKLFRNMVSIRDYIVRKCILENVSLKIIHEGEYMILNPDDLKNKSFQLTKQKFDSKFIDNKKYELMDFYWNPIN